MLLEYYCKSLIQCKSLTLNTMDSIEICIYNNSNYKTRSKLVNLVEGFIFLKNISSKTILRAFETFVCENFRLVLFQVRRIIKVACSSYFLRSLK